MKFLIDNNLSFRLAAALLSHFPGTEHVRNALSVLADDISIWEHAKKNSFTILTKDNDFDELSQFHGCPPKVIHLICGNKSTLHILHIILQNRDEFLAFDSDKDSCLLKVS